MLYARRLSAPSAPLRLVSVTATVPSIGQALLHNLGPVGWCALAAMFGGGHPYARAVTSQTTAKLTEGDIAQFRAARYTPDNATLVIAGRFDAALADRWIDYLFADWTGHVGPRTSERATPQPASAGLTADPPRSPAPPAAPAPARRHRHRRG